MRNFAYDENRCTKACEHIAWNIVRPLVHRYFQHDRLAVELKHDKSVVTEADREIERAIRVYLEHEFRGFGVIGEEYTATDPQSELVWSIDPIDGTEALIAGLPLFGTLIALIRQENNGRRTPVLGALYLPIQDQLVIGTGAETRLNGRRITVAQNGAVDRTQLLVGDLSAIARTMQPEQQERLLRLAAQYRSTQTWGDCLGYVSLLTGGAHARIDADLGIDDIAPLEPIILGAGGCVSTWDGESLSSALSSLKDLSDTAASFNCVAAATRAAHSETLRALTG